MSNMILGIMTNEGLEKLNDNFFNWFARGGIQEISSQLPAWSTGLPLWNVDVPISMYISK